MSLPQVQLRFGSLRDDNVILFYMLHDYLNRTDLVFVCIIRAAVALQA